MTDQRNAQLEEISLLIRSGMVEQADEKLAKLQADGKPSPGLLTLVALRQQQQGHGQALMETLDQLLALDPANKSALFGLIGLLDKQAVAPALLARMDDGMRRLALIDPTALMGLAALYNHQAKRDDFTAMLDGFPASYFSQPPVQQAIIAVTHQWHQAGHSFAAWNIIEKAVSLAPDALALLAAAGLLAASIEKPFEAIRLLEQALQQSPQDVTQLELALAKSHLQLGDYDKAIPLLERMIERQPDIDHAWKMLGLAAIEINDADRLAKVGDYLADQPLTEAADWFYRALHLKMTGETKASIEHLKAAVERDPDFARAWAELAELYAGIDEMDQAEMAAERALAIEPNMVTALLRLGTCLRDSLRQNEAVTYFKRAVERDPSNARSQRVYLFSANYADQMPPGELAAEHQAYGDLLAKRAGPVPDFPAKDPDKRLRVAFLSGDFRRHSVGYFLLPLYRGLKQHVVDDAGCELISVSCHDAKPDDFVSAFREESDEWVDAFRLSDRDLIEKLRALNIDVAIDLAGYTTDERQAVFAARVAPVQLAFLGYPNTTGIAAIDGRITDAVADPPGQTEQWHREPLFRLDDSFLCYDATPTGDELPPASAIEHPKIRFGCFNNLSKVTRHQAEIWAQILDQVPNSKLIFKTKAVNAPAVREQLAQAFAATGLDLAGRLEMRGQTKGHLDHLAMYREVDIALDTFHYTGTTTTCEALVMGTPVLTKTAEHHASRVSASILACVGLDDLITDNDADYISRAKALADDVAGIRAGREALRAQFLASPLADPAPYAQKFMGLMRDAWRKICFERNS